MRIFLLFLLPWFALGQVSWAQQDTFQLEIQELSFEGFPGVHSGALASYNGRWMYLGGRVNGLHGFQSPFAFPAFGKNTNVWLCNPTNGELNSFSLSDFTEDLYEPLTSSNIPFCNDGQFLYLVGGYGWSNAANDFRTFPSLIRVNLNCLETALISGNPDEMCFEQILDERMAITGGHLKLLNDTFYLVFGHRFDGIYAVNNGNNAFYNQTYSNQIRKFTIENGPEGPEIANFSVIEDTVNFHRRDYNLVSQVFPDRSLGFTAFSGVFQKNAVLPFLNTIDVHPSSGAEVIPGFDQHLSQYHNAVAPLYDSIGNVMHTVFFGGMSRYRIDPQTQEMIDDTLVPFVKTISMVSRFADGSLEERQLSLEMPGFLGSNMEFIPAQGIQLYAEGIIHTNALPNERTLIGYLVGGILSPEENISETDPSLSSANDKVYEVYFNRTNSDTGIVTGISAKPSLVISSFQVMPNPAGQSTQIELNIGKPGQVNVLVYDRRGQLIRELLDSNIPAGKHQIKFDCSDLSNGVYFIKAQSNRHSKTISFIVQH